MLYKLFQLKTGSLPFLSKILMCLALMVVTGCVSQSSIVGAATAEELQSKIEEQRKLIQDLDQRIKEYSELTDKTSQEAKSLNDVINQLKQNQKVLDLDISKTRAQITKASLDIEDLDNKIVDSKTRIANYKDAIETSIKDINQKEQTGLIEIFLAKKSLSSILNEIDQLSQFNRQIGGAIEQLDSEKRKLQQTQDTKIATKDELIKFQNQLTDKKKVIEYNKAEQARALKETENKKKSYQQLLDEQLAKKAAFEKELFAYESQLKYTLDPSSIPAAGNTVFSWPLDKVTITQRFGKTSASGRLYVSGSHNGVDFGAKIGTPVKAVLSGTVVGTGDTDITCPRASFGRWVFIKHDNGLSTIYGHLSVISAQQGQRVNTGDIIGYSGNTGYSTGPHLHISAYASDAVSVQQRPSTSCGGKIYTMPIAPVDAYLDPMVYFPKI
ncbi:MAG: peptidoglycan DD-metalloendopeptidase family protein [Patescibacteria group bacterium]